MLTPRQREILALVARGQTSREIGRALGISPSTVKQHMTNILAALNAKNRAHAVTVATQRGLLAQGGEDAE